MRRALALTAALAGCGGDEGPETAPPAEPEAWTWALPAGFPTPVVPADNPMSAAKVELGRFLFYDKRLSASGTQSCASCHEQARAFSDGRVRPLGSTHAAHPRNAPGLVNVGYNTTLTWANPGLDRLEQQICVPLIGDGRVSVADWAGVIDRFRGDPVYVERFAAAFPEDDDPVSLERVVDALACFLRSMVAGQSPYDRLVAGDPTALSLAAKRGMALFFDSRLGCHHCHGGFNFTQSTVHAGQSVAERPFHNTGLYDIDGEGGYPLDNTGLYEITRRPEDMGRFRAPTLRNVALTAPYMHDGSVATLEEVVDIYAAGGRLIERGPYAGDGRANRFKSGFVSGFSISDGEKADLLAFLRSLTDEGFVTDPRFADPFE